MLSHEGKFMASILLIKLEIVYVDIYRKSNQIYRDRDRNTEKWMIFIIDSDQSEMWSTYGTCINISFP